MNKVSAIETERLLIRSVQLTDVGALHEGIFRDPELMGTGIYLGRALSYEESLSIVERMCTPRHANHYIAPSVFFLRETNDLVGYGGLSSETNWGDLYYTNAARLDAELFYVLQQSYWGQGLATEMAKAVIEDAFLSQGVDRVWASINSANKASQRVVEKAGMLRSKEIAESDQRLYLYEITRSRQQ